MSKLEQVLSRILGDKKSKLILEHVFIPHDFHHIVSNNKENMALYLNLALFSDLIDRVPDSERYMREQKLSNRKVFFDHGALRTIKPPENFQVALPAGHQAFSRILEPLGYQQHGIYPLERIKMCGFVYTHETYPEFMPQYFVSEIYPDKFSQLFQERLKSLIKKTKDPLTKTSVHYLNELKMGRTIDDDAAVSLIKNLVSCFDRQHPMPSLEDYHLFLDESAEMAWISTEGNAFNHATDRVDDLDKVAEHQRKLGRPMKPSIEEGVNANIRQTAYRATHVTRCFPSPDGDIEKPVPGSFFEFIERGKIKDPDTGKEGLDLRFDSKNAQGIFKMTKQ